MWLYYGVMTSFIRAVTTPSVAIRGILVLMLSPLVSCTLPRDKISAQAEPEARVAIPADWTGPVLRWAVVPPLDVNGVTRPELESVARKAFAGWQKAGVVRFIKAGPGEKADILIGFGSPPDDDPSNKRAIAWSYPSGSPHPGLIRLSSEVGWTTNPWQIWRQPLQWVLPNRVGRVLGLPQNPRYDSIMSVQFPSPAEPTAYDLMALRRLYQGPEVAAGQ